MRLLLINHLHPDSGLVGAVRMQRFAEELARRGHQVVLLCAGHDGEPDTPTLFAARAACHDWSQPLVVAVRDDSPLHNQMRARQLPPLPRKFATAFDLAWHGGPFWRWRRSAAGFYRPIHRLLDPEVAFATFGNLDALAIARRYAHRHRIPWVMDIKDPALEFLPFPLRGWLMPRYADAAAVTLNSEHQRTHNGCWARDDAIVIHSGVEGFHVADGGCNQSQVALVGSLYSGTGAEVLMRAFSAWRNDREPGGTLHYFGVDAEKASELARRLGVTQGLILEGQVPRAELLGKCARMAALMFAVHPGGAFHHKLLELAALGRPLIASPALGPEEQRLCTRFSIPLTCITSESDGARALAAASAAATVAMTDLVRKMSWAECAARLEGVFRSVLTRNATAGGSP